MFCFSYSAKSCSLLYALYNVPNAFNFKDILTLKMSMNSMWEKKTIKGKTDKGKMAAQGKGTKRTENQNLVIKPIYILTSTFCAIYDKTVIVHSKLYIAKFYIIDYESDQFQGVQDTISLAPEFHSSNVASLHIYLKQFVTYIIISTRVFI